MPPLPVTTFPLIRPVFCLVGLAMLCLTAKAQPPRNEWAFYAWRVDDGLPDNNVSAVRQMPDGTLLVATYGGLVRFDGLRMNPMNGGPGSGRGSLVRTMLSAKDGALWLAMGQGTITRRLNDEVQTFQPPGKTGSYPRGLCEDATGAVWVSFSEGEVARIDQGEITMFGINEGLPGNAWCRFAVDQWGELWGVTGEALLVFRQGRFIEMARLKTEPNWQRASCIYPAADGGLWVSVGLKLYHYQENTGLVPLTILPEDEARVSISVLFEDRQKRLWAGLYEGTLYLVNDGAPQNCGKTNHEIRALADDHEGSLWIGASEGGLWRVRPKVLDMLSNVDPPIFEAMHSVAMDRTGDIWMTGTNGFLFKRARGLWTRFTKLQGWPEVDARCLAAGADGSMWIGTRNQAVYAWTEGGGFHHVPLPGNAPWGNIRAILMSRTGDLHLAIDGNLWRLSHSDWKWFPSHLHDSYIQTLVEDHEGRIWAGTSMGQLLCLLDDELKDVTPEVLDDSAIRGLLATEKGELWIGGGNAGLACLKDGKLTRLGEDHGISQNGISHLLLDDQQRLWCGSTQGIFFLPMEDLRQAVMGKLGSVRPTVFGKQDGVANMQSSRGYWPSAMKDSTGRLWFCMRSGTVRVDPTAVRPNREPPPVIIEELRVDGEKVALQHQHQAISIPPEHRNLEFRFAALSFVSPENVQVRHRLDGLDEDWIDSSTDRKAVYSRLTAGDYALRVKASNNDSVWNETGAVLAFRVKPFLWQTLWFRLAALTLFAGCIAYVARAYTKRRLRLRMAVLEREAAVERERARIARDMHDDVGASLTQIAIAGKLGQLAPLEKASSHLGEIATIARKAVTSLDEIVWAVNPRHDTLASLVDYLTQHALDFLQSAGMELELDVPATTPSRGLPTEFRHHLFLVVKEGLSNIVKHSAASKVKLSMAYGDSGLRIVLEDNGRGFDPQQLAKMGSDGLGNVKERIAEIGGLCHWESEAGQGTKMILGLPWPEMIP